MTEHVNKGDALRADRIAASARDISDIRVVNRTGAHKGQSTILKDNAYCVIEVPLKIITNKK